MLKYLQLLGHQIIPYLIPAPQTRLDSKEAEKVIDHLNQTPETRNEFVLNNIFNAAYNVVDTAILGGMLAILDEFQKRASNDQEDMNFEEMVKQNQDLIILSMSFLVARISLGFGKNLVNSHSLKESNVASQIKNGLRVLTPQQLENALQICAENGDLNQIMVPDAGMMKMVWSKKTFISYLIGGFVAELSPIDENEKYLMLAAVKVISSYLLERVEKFASNYVGETKYFSEQFLNNFSDDQKDEIAKVLLKELRHHKGCSEDIEKVIIGAAATFSFVATTHQSPISYLEDESLKKGIFCEFGNFGLGSISSNTTAHLLNMVREIFKKNNQVGVIRENYEVGDEESGIELRSPRASSLDSRKSNSADIEL